MGILNEVPYATAPETEQWVADGVEVMPKLGVKVMLLAFFSNGDILDRPDLQRQVVRRLKKVAPAAEKAGVVLGVESWLNAETTCGFWMPWARRPCRSTTTWPTCTNRATTFIARSGSSAANGSARSTARKTALSSARDRSISQGQRGGGRNRLLRLADHRRGVGPGMTMQDSYVENQKFLRSIFPTRR